MFIAAFSRWLKNGNAVNQWISEQNVVYPYNGILFNHKKEQSIGKDYNTVKAENRQTVRNRKPFIV